MFLSLDTSTLTLSMALLEGADPVREVAHVLHAPPRKQSEMLPGVIAELLAAHGVTLGALEGIVVGLGPGSFTGLRIGLASAKALAYAAKLPLAGGSSLAAVALEGPEDRVLLPIAVARQQELYVGHYERRGNQVHAAAPEDAMTPAELAKRVMSDPRAVLLGPAVVDYRAQLESLGVPSERILDVGVVPSSVALGQLVRPPPAFDAQVVFSLEPHYVRGAEAERNPKFPAAPGWSATARLKED